MSATARATASPLAGALEVWQSRDGAPTRGDRLYLVYVAVLTVLVIGVPAGRTVIGALARPDVIPYLLSGSAPNVLTGAWLALCALLVLVGAVRGPALLTPFFTVTLASSSMPRRRALLRPFARALGALAALVTVLGALMAGTLVQAGLASAGEAAVCSAACAGAALLAGCWERSQGRRCAGSSPVRSCSRASPRPCSRAVDSSDPGRRCPVGQELRRTGISRRSCSSSPGSQRSSSARSV